MLAIVLHRGNRTEEAEQSCGKFVVAHFFYLSLLSVVMFALALVVFLRAIFRKEQSLNIPGNAPTFATRLKCKSMLIKRTRRQRPHTNVSLPTGSKDVCC